MPLLALDTAIHQCAAAVLMPDGVVFSRAERIEKGHAERLPLMVEEVLREARLTFADLHRLACTTGPGSFTGIRVALSLARGYRLALGLPLTGVTTLAAMARPCLGAKPVLAAIAAGRGEVYAQLFGAGGAELSQPECIAIQDLAERLSGGSGLIVGSGGRDIAALASSWHLAERDLPDIASVALIAASREATASETASPLYLRPPDARPSTFRLERASDFHV